MKSNSIRLFCRFGAIVLFLLLTGVLSITAQQDVADVGFGEIVDVQLVNVEAWVTDSKGNPVLGLTVDDFEIFEDGKPVDVSYFSEVGADKLRTIVTTPPQEEEIPPPFTLEPPAENPNLSPAYLVLYFDQIHLTATSRKTLIRDVRPFLDSGVVNPENVLILRQEGNLYTEANFGSDRIDLEMALERIAKSGTAGTITQQEKRLAVTRLNLLWEEIVNISERSDPCDQFVNRAQVEVTTYSRMAANRTLVTLENLDNVASFLGGVPGVKTLIYVSDTLEMTPGRDLLRLVQERCPGRPEPQQYNLVDSMNPAFFRMTRSANANRVTFYSIQPSGLRSDFMSMAETRGSDFITGTAQISGALRQSDRSGMSFVASETGGQAIFNRNRFDKEFVRIGQEMTSYYSLAYTPSHGGDRGDHAIKVRIKGKDNLKVRHRRGYRDKGPEERTTDKLFSTLYLGLSDNPLDARLGAGGMQASEDKKYAFQLHVMVPADRLTFMPQETGAKAGVRIEVAAKDPEKVKIFKTRSEYEIPEPEAGVDDAPLIDMVLNLRLEKGKYVLAVVVTDGASQISSYVSTSVEISPPDESPSTGP